MDGAEDPRAASGSGAAHAAEAAPAAPPPPPPPSILALPQLALDGIAAALFPDARALVGLSASCRALRGLDGPALWEAWSARRFGPGAVPPGPPADGPVRAAAVEGFLFFQGVAPPGGTRSSDPHASLAALAGAAHESDAEAFATDGRLFPQLPPYAAWQNARWSLDPRAGLYVSHHAACRLGLENPPEPPAPATWPPRADPEWLYFGGVDARIPLRPGNAITDELPSCATVEQLLARGATAAHPVEYVAPPRGPAVVQLPAVAATTSGRLIFAGRLPTGDMVTSLPPQANWRAVPDWGTGLYVRADAAGLLGIAPPLDRDSPRALAGALRRNYLRLSALALEAHELDAVWLDGQHLVLQDAPERPSPVGASRLPGPRPTSMLRTAAVCWLDVRGSIRGVLPGEYEVAWCMNLIGAHMTPHLDSLTLTAAVQGGDARCEAAFTAQQLVQLRLEAHRDRVVWSWVRGGRLRVPACDAPAAVEVAFTSHTNHWKQGIHFGFVQLLPVASGVAEQALARSPGAWDGGRTSGGGGEGGSGGGAGGLRFPGALTDALMAAAGCRQQ